MDNERKRKLLRVGVAGVLAVAISITTFFALKHFIKPTDSPESSAPVSVDKEIEPVPTTEDHDGETKTPEEAVAKEEEQSSTDNTNKPDLTPITFVPSEKVIS